MTERAPSELKAALSALPGVSVREVEPLSRHTPLRTGGPADLWVNAPDLDTLKKALTAARKAHMPWKVHWPLTDWLVREGGLPGVVVRPGRDFEHVRKEGEHVILGAAAPWAGLSALGAGWWDRIATWSGSVGGLLDGPDRSWLNGWCVRLRWIKGRRVEDIALGDKDPVPELPRTAIPLEVELRRGLAIARRRPRPPGPGALFADPAVHGADATAGATLQNAGMVGSRLRDWRLSAVEPGALIQLGRGSAEDALMLAQGISRRVERLRGVQLKVRIPVLGKTPRERLFQSPPGARR